MASLRQMAGLALSAVAVRLLEAPFAPITVSIGRSILKLEFFCQKPSLKFWANLRGALFALETMQICRGDVFFAHFAKSKNQKFTNLKFSLENLGKNRIFERVEIWTLSIHFCLDGSAHNVFIWNSKIQTRGKIERKIKNGIFNSNFQLTYNPPYSRVGSSILAGWWKSARDFSPICQSPCDCRR